MGDAEAAGAARDAAPAPGSNSFERADRRDHHRQAQLAAEQLDRGVDMADVAQHARPERDLVERHAVAAQVVSVSARADDVVPGILVEVGARLAHELVQVLELFATGAELDGRRRDAGRFVHGVLSRMHGWFCLSRTVSRAFAPSRKLLWLVSAGRKPEKQEIAAHRREALP